MNNLWKDLRYGARLLAKRPGFTFVVVITLALGIGASTTIFSVVNAVLVRQQPYVDARKLVYIESGNKEADAAKFGGIAPADFWDYKQQAESFEQVVAFRGDGFGITGVDNPETVPAQSVTINFFDALKAKPLIGRIFEAKDEQMQASTPVVLSYQLWQRRFGGDPNIIEKTIGDTKSFVIGVMPEDFEFIPDVELWTPLSPQSPEMKNRANRYFNTIGLLKEGQSIESAQAELQTIASRLEAEYPATNKNITSRLTLFRERRVRDVKTSLLVLMGSVGLVLLIACANVANLLLARSMSRRKEIAICLALGASRSQIIRQLLTESLLLSVLSAVVGLLFAVWGIDVLINFLPQNYAYLQLQDQVRIDGVVLLFTILMSIGTSVLFGLLPALQASKPQVNEWLKDGGKSSSSLQTQRTRGLFVIAEMAIALVLLISAGLLMQSFIRLRNNELGFNPQNLFSANISASFAKYPTNEAKAQFYKQMVEQVAQTPGIEEAAISSGIPFPYLHFNFNIEGSPLSQELDSLYDSISPNYFRTIKARLLEGREFDNTDTRNSPAVAIVNESFARRLFPDESAVGKRITYNYLGAPTKREIVGVVADHKQGEAGKVLPQCYVPYQQTPWLSASIIIRSTASPASVRNEVQNAIWSVDKTQTPFTARLFEESLSNALSEPRLYTMLLGAFASLAFVLAIVGVYSVMAYMVTQNTRDIGIRMALGAQQSDVMKMVVVKGMKIAITGIVIGLGLSLAVTRLLKSLLFEVSTTDPVTFLVLALALGTVALAACYIPARRATKVDPMITLRYE